MRLIARIAALCLIAVGVLVACAPLGPTSASSEIKAGPTGDVVEVVENVGYYPACGNELIEVNGVAWFPFTPTDDSPLPDDPFAATLGGEAAADGGSGIGVMTAALSAVAPPGPGDDMGTLVIFENDLAYWGSDSGNLETWLTRNELTYNWAC